MYVLCDYELCIYDNFYVYVNKPFVCGVQMSAKSEIQLFSSISKINQTFFMAL